jgi:DNA-binding NarL/FixJ family response regulator
MIKVLIIEDDIIIRNNVVHFLSSQEYINVCGEFSSIENFNASVYEKEISPDVVLLDIVLPGLSGIEGIRFIKDRYPKTLILMFSVMDDGFSIFRSLCEGAIGYITKEFTMESLRNALIDVYEGRGSMSPSIARKVAEYFHPKKKLSESLTPREVDIVNGIIEGLSYKLLASKLEISIDTVRKHIKNIYRKLQINSKSQLMSRYFNN